MSCEHLYSEIKGHWVICLIGGFTMYIFYLYSKTTFWDPDVTVCRSTIVVW